MGTIRYDHVLTVTVKVTVAVTGTHVDNNGALQSAISAARDTSPTASWEQVVPPPEQMTSRMSCSTVVFISPPT